METLAVALSPSARVAEPGRLGGRLERQKDRQRLRERENTNRNIQTTVKPKKMKTAGFLLSTP